jgi:hypothetical protein
MNELPTIPDPALLTDEELIELRDRRRMWAGSGPRFPEHKRSSQNLDDDIRIKAEFEKRGIPYR